MTMDRDERGDKKPEQWQAFIPEPLQSVLPSPPLSVCWVHALAVEVGEVLLKLSRSGEGNQITALQWDSPGACFLFPVLILSSVIAWRRVGGLGGAPLQPEFHLRMHWKSA